jgi:hypothetical protein
MTYGNHSTGKTLAMLGGIAAGAALMYLFDPEEGQARRQNLTEGANDALSKAGTSLGALGTAAASSLHGGVDATGSTLSSLAERARALAATIGEHAHAATSAAATGVAGAAERGYGAVRDTTGDWAQRTSTATRNSYDDAAGSTRAAYDRAAKAYDDARAGLRYDVEVEDEKSSHTGSIVIGTGTAALLGAAAIYFLDSEKGADRRQQAVDLCNRVVINTRELAQDLAEKVKDRMGQSGPAAPMDYATSDDYMGTDAPEVGRDVPSSSANAI